MRRLLFAAGLLTLLAPLSACASPGPRWRPSAELGEGCTPHQHALLGSPRGQLREPERPAEHITATWDQLGFAEFQITRGAGGWWVADKGGVDLVRSQIDGTLWWLADGREQFERIADGRYVGVVVDPVDATSVLAVRSECRVSAFGRGVSWTIVERLTRTASGWSAPIEVRRFGGLCPFHAIADAQGRPLIVAWVIASDAPDLEVLRVEGDRLRSVGGFPVVFPQDAGAQIDRTPTGDLLLSSGYAAWTEDPDATPDPVATTATPTRLLRWIDDDHLAAGWLVSGCPAVPLPTQPTPPTRERALGIAVTRTEDLTFVDVRPDYTDLAAILAYVDAIVGPVRLGITGLDLRGEHELLLGLREGVSLMLIQSTTKTEWDALAEARPNLFSETAWSRDYE